jgi:hypothetical protein
MRLDGIRQLKIPMISTEIEPSTVRLVAQSLNQLRYLVHITGGHTMGKIVTFDDCIVNTAGQPAILVTTKIQKNSTQQSYS